MRRARIPHGGPSPRNAQSQGIPLLEFYDVNRAPFCH